MTNLKNLLFENVQNILMTCCQVSDRCPLGYLFMLHASFKVIGLLILEKKFLKLFTIYGSGVHLGHVTLGIYTKFCSQFRRRNLALIGKVVSEKIFEKGGRMDGRRLDGSTISSPCEPNGSGELKSHKTRWI